MRVNSYQESIYKNNKISYGNGRKIITTLSNTDSLAATIALESCVTGGRGINAYKRGGFPEFRERFTDDVVSAIFWMKGVDIFNNIGNKIGEHVLKLPLNEFDVGKDALRTPFRNYVDYLSNTVTNKQELKALEKKLAAFKFTKIILSTLLATGFVGFALPKINQAITKKLMSKNNNKENKSDISKTGNNNSFAELLTNKYSFEEFDKNTISSKTQSFKGISPEVMTTVAHYLENNKICKMLTCDAGILTGRVKTARNADEGREYFFRDASSSFFYFASTPLIYKLLQTISKSSGLTTIDPVAAEQLNANLIQQLQNTDGSYAAMSVENFAAKTIGSIDNKTKEFINKLPFNSDVISLAELKKHITDENLLNKAAELAKLQPEQSIVGSVLTKQQVMDAFKTGSISEPKFMETIYSTKFGDDLINKYKFIPMKKITSFRDNIDKYVESVINIAKKKNGGIVDKNLLEKINKKSYIMSSGFRIAAMAFSAVALGIVIPKLQYAMTLKRTGSNSAPGLREYNNEKQDT